MILLVVLRQISTNPSASSALCRNSVPPPNSRGSAGTIGTGYVSARSSRSRATIRTQPLRHMRPTRSNADNRMSVHVETGQDACDENLNTARGDLDGIGGDDP